MIAICQSSATQNTLNGMRQGAINLACFYFKGIFQNRGAMEQALHRRRLEPKHGARRKPRLGLIQPLRAFAQLMNNFVDPLLIGANVTLNVQYIAFRRNEPQGRVFGEAVDHVLQVCTLGQELRNERLPPKIAIDSMQRFLGMKLEHRVILAIQQKWQQRHEGPNVSAFVVYLINFGIWKLRFDLCRDVLIFTWGGGNEQIKRLFQGRQGLRYVWPS